MKSSTERREAKPKQAFVIFGIRGTLYGIDALAVREVMPRPALTHLTGVVATCVGLLNLRGKGVPVLDVSALLGGTMQPPSVRDHIVIVEHAGQYTGLLVGAIHDVRLITPSDVQGVPLTTQYNTATGIAYPELTASGALHSNGTVQYDTEATETAQEANPNVFTGLVRLDDDLILLLNLPALIGGTTSLTRAATSAAELESVDEITTDEGADTDAILRARAATLRQVQTASDEDGDSIKVYGPSHATDEGVGIAVVTLGGEAFGLPLDVVREFCRVGTVTPVPCCPSHVLGQMNLRGDLLTLLDLRTSLGLVSPVEVSETGGEEMAVVVEVGTLRAGVLVEEVREVTHLRAATLPSGSEALSNGGSLPWGGTLPWGATALNLLDLSQFLARPELLVREEV